MHHIKLFLALMALSFSGFAQTYNVSVCGTVGGLGGGTATIELSYSVGNTFTLTSDTTTPMGGYCFNFSLAADTAGYANTSIAITEPGCFSPVTIPLGDLWISSDTVFTVDFQYCDDPSGGSCYNPAQVDTFAVCPTIYAPVCGCDGITYNNSCEAYNRGVTSWTEGICGNSCTSYIYEQVDSFGITLYVSVANGTAPYTYEWNTGDINNGIIPSGPGQYCASVIDALGCVSTSCYDFYPNTGNCTAYIYLDTSGTTLNLIAAPGEGTSPYTYQWYYNGAFRDTTYALLAPDTGEYCLIITDATGCEASTCYTSGNTGTCSVDIVQYNDSITGDYLWAFPTGIAPFTYEWYFNNVFILDSTDGIIPNEAGYICVYVTDAMGCMSSSCYNYTMGDTACYVNIYQTTNDSITYTLYADAHGVAPYQYTWYYENTLISTVSSSVDVNGFGQYCVDVIDSTGCYSSTCYYLGVNPFCSVVFSSYVAPTMPPGQQSTVIFTSYSSGVGPFTYQWYYSDGGTDTVPDPVHTYAQTGGWDWAYLEVTDVTGCVAYYSDYVFLNDSNFTQPCSAGFDLYMDDISGIPGQTAFVDYSYSSGSIVSWAWDFGDGSTSALQNPVHTYVSAGNYTICLTITDYSGCSSSTCWTYYIDPAWWGNNPGGGNGNACAAGFIAMQDSSMNGVVYLVDISYGSNLAYSWDFGNGTVVNDQYPYLSFTNEGWLYICLTVTDTVTGCYSTYCDSVGVDANGYLRDASVNWSVNVIPGVVTPLSTVGVEDDAVNPFMVTLYPNPVNDVLNLQITSPGRDELNMEVIDVTGKLIRSNVIAVSKGVSVQRINMSDIAEGVYFIKLVSPEMNETLRFVKTR